MAPGIAAITVKNGVNYDAPDGQDVKLCFIITDRISGIVCCHSKMDRM